MKYSVSEFARQIRKMYPNDYDDLSDIRLVELWLKKYPNDINKVDINQIGQSEVPRKKAGYFKYVLIAMLLTVAFLTKPSFRDHKDTILNEVLYPLVDKVGNEVGINDLSSLNFLGVDVVQEGLKKYMDDPDNITFKDYYLISTVEYEGQTVSYGAFGIVFIPPQVKDEINKQVKRIIDGTKSLLNNEKDVPYFEKDRNMNAEKDNSNIDELMPDASFQQDMPTDTVSIYE